MIYGIIFGLSLIVGALTKMVGWAILVGIIIDLCLFLWHKHGPAFKAWRKERRTGKAGEQPAPSTTPAGKPAEKKSYGKLIGWGVVLALIGWSWYSIENEIGFPGNYATNKAYDHPEPFTFTAKAFTEEGERVKLKGVKPGKWKFTFPDQWILEVGNNQKYRSQAGFCILSAKGNPMPMIFSDSVMVNGKLAGRETIDIGPDGYVTIHVFLGNATEEERKKTILLGKPIKVGPAGYICPREPEGTVSDRIQLQG
jgi:hypothetical protein